MVDRRLIIDACCLINLDASGQLLDIARCFSPSLIVSSIVYDEEILALEQIEGDTGEAVKSKLIEKVDLDDTELSMFIQYASHMGDDGESATFAVAINRGFSVATDDRAAINFLTRLGTNLKVFSTLDIIKFWAEVKNKSEEDVRQALLQIKDRGRYVPSKSHPLYAWWYANISQ